MVKKAGRVRWELSILRIISKFNFKLKSSSKI